MGLQDRDYYWEKQKQSVIKQSTKHKPSQVRQARPRKYASQQPPDLGEVFKRIPFIKILLLLIVGIVIGFFIYPILML